MLPKPEHVENHLSLQESNGEDIEDPDIQKTTGGGGQNQQAGTTAIKR